MTQTVNYTYNMQQLAIAKTKLLETGYALIKLFSCSTRQSMKFQMFIISKILKILFLLKSLRCIYSATKCWHLNIFEPDEIHAHLSSAGKQLMTTGSDLLDFLLATCIGIFWLS